MTWLALKILGYLLMAFFIGTAAGWVLTKTARRDRLYTKLAGAAAEITELRRQLDARPAMVDTPTAPLADPSADPITGGENRAILDQSSAELQQLKQRAEIDQERLNEVEAARPATENLLAALHREIARLRQQLVEANEASRPNAALELTVKELEGRLVRKMAEIDRLQRTLNSEERKVGELERERELQNKSLLVLHQQLEMERKPQRAAI